jgi:hypothetical protein
MFILLDLPDIVLPIISSSRWNFIFVLTFVTFYSFWLLLPFSFCPYLLVWIIDLLMSHEHQVYT